ncbi:MAG: esterase, partial [Selenomonadaceae bacterium]|nr:esterase [Selenomonadaceae bacterium]
MTIKPYGAGGLPILVFPTQDAMSDNFENFGMIDTLKDFIDGGQIQLFCVDTVDQETWSNIWGDKVWRAARQESYSRYI